MHLIPADRERAITWFHYLGRLDLEQVPFPDVRRKMCVCDLHFSENQKFIGVRNRSNLKMNSVPDLNCPATSLDVPPPEAHSMHSPSATQTVEDPGSVQSTSSDNLYKLPVFSGANYDTQALSKSSVYNIDHHSSSSAPASKSDSHHPTETDATSGTSQSVVTEVQVFTVDISKPGNDQFVCFHFCIGEGKSMLSSKLKSIIGPSFLDFHTFMSTEMTHLIKVNTVSCWFLTILYPYLLPDHEYSMMEEVQEIEVLHPLFREDTAGIITYDLFYSDEANFINLTYLPS
jgi:hypothetical protein